MFRVQFFAEYNTRGIVKEKPWNNIILSLVMPTRIYPQKNSMYTTTVHALWKKKFTA